MDSDRRISYNNEDTYYPKDTYDATIRAIGNGVIIKHNGTEVFYDPNKEDDMGYLADFLAGL